MLATVDRGFTAYVGGCGQSPYARSARLAERRFVPILTTG
jgi:hypothetical protein